MRGMYERLPQRGQGMLKSSALAQFDDSKAFSLSPAKNIRDFKKFPINFLLHSEKI